jgi:hypothetical protein
MQLEYDKKANKFPQNLGKRHKATGMLIPAEQMAIPI